jgi:hypothetical protein
MRFNPQQAPLSYQNKRTLFYQEKSKIEVKYNMAVGPIRKQLLWNLMLLIMTEAEFL